MDVHPAHHAPRTWRDFFLQLLMITIGLFIALTLQAGVESLHHRHLVRDARENLRREIETNHNRYAENVQYLEKNRRQLAHNIDQLKDLRSGKAIDKGALAFGSDWNSYSDASWKTARDTGAVSYMSSDLINIYTDVYSQQEYVDTRAIAIMDDEPKSAAPLRVAQDPSALSPSDIQSMLISLAETDIKLATLQLVMKSLDEMYMKAMKDL
jgi:cell division protein FtsB